MSNSQRVAIITGDSRGIGEAFRAHADLRHQDHSGETAARPAPLRRITRRRIAAGRASIA